MAQTRRSSVAAADLLAPLTGEEISAAVGILTEERELGAKSRFAGVYLNEPPKEKVLAYKSGEEAPEREAFVIVLDGSNGETYEALVSLTQGKVNSWEHAEGAQPSIMLDEFDECERATKEDPEFREALKKRGITNLDLVCVEPWSAGFYGDDDGDDDKRRLLRTLVYTRLEPGDNPYAHPVDDLVAVFDLNSMKVVRVEDFGVVPVPQEKGNYTPEAVGQMREDLKPIEITQPEGPSFELNGHEISWQKWRFVVGFTPREGIVLHNVTYRDGDRERSVLYRASLAEMVVPYGDPDPVQYRKNAFDAGEYNIGALANSLELGCDCLGEIRYLDAVMADSRGNPLPIKNAICLHEEDFGLLSKHTDFRTGQVDVRRSRRFVASFIATVANYEYGFYWYFYQDGTIEFEVKLTGIVSTAYASPEESPKYGQLLNKEGLYAPIHQHLFNVRLDLDIDGRENSVYEVHTEAEPIGSENPHGNAFFAKPTLLKSEKEAQQVVDSMAARYWKVVNPSVKNAVGEPVGYKLIPHGNVLPFAQPESHIVKRAGFATKHFWATPYKPSELYAAGDYPNQHRGGSGLPEYTKDDRPIENEDVVIWYTLGSHHTVRLEDWPVMPMQYAGFKLQPIGFFDQNPSLDVPPPGGNGHCHHGG
ncbi:MAG: Monoamine oxidase [uncultured Rubrobacteraceae bacterium]|uniref:Amine oxidase n=1 Tax=uncultured Rubrobacteraceae bacterium TaxID=349277 RepID=A0A6J4QAZ9_9ACTN|nr:MAG: Monoamine oxidase [uncultured Rubrobacteraceae bacterium]